MHCIPLTANLQEMAYSHQFPAQPLWKVVHGQSDIHSCCAQTCCKLVCLQIRVMPNTPCLIGQAASAYVIGTHATESDTQKTYALMSSVGKLVKAQIRLARQQGMRLCTVPATVRAQCSCNLSIYLQSCNLVEHWEKHFIQSRFCTNT